MKRWYAFFPIFILAMIGSGLLSAIINLQQKLPDTLTSYYDQANTFDAIISCESGFTVYDLESFQNDSQTSDIEEFWNIEYPAVIADTALTLKAFSYNDRISSFTIINGRAPESSSECLIDELLADVTGVDIGDSIALDSSSSFGDTILSNSQLIVVGICRSAFYTSYDRHLFGDSTAPDYCYIVMNKDAFLMPATNLLLIKSDADEEEKTYASQVTSLFTACQTQDSQDAIAEPAEQLSTASQDYDALTDDISSLTDSSESIIASYFQIWKDAADVSEAARTEIEAKREALYLVDYSKEDADAALANKETEVEALEEITKTARETYTTAVKTYQDQLQELNDQRDAISETMQQLQSVISSSEAGTFSVYSKSSLSSWQSLSKETEQISSTAEDIKHKSYILIAVAFGLLAVLIGFGLLHTVNDLCQDKKGIKSLLAGGIAYSFVFSITGIAAGSFLGVSIFTNPLYDFYRTVNLYVPLAQKAFNISSDVFFSLLGVLIVGLFAFGIVYIPFILTASNYCKRKLEHS